MAARRKKKAYRPTIRRTAGASTKKPQRGKEPRVLLAKMYRELLGRNAHITQERIGDLAVGVEGICGPNHPIARAAWDCFNADDFRLQASTSGLLGASTRRMVREVNALAVFYPINDYADVHAWVEHPEGIRQLRFALRGLRTQRCISYGTNDPWEPAYIRLVTHAAGLPRMTEHPWEIADADGQTIEAGSEDFSFPTAEAAMAAALEFLEGAYPDPSIVDLGVSNDAHDYEEYVGNEEDGIYIYVGRRREGWYYTLVVDSNTGGFVQDLARNGGPFDSRNSAAERARYIAFDWCATNNVVAGTPQNYEIVDRGESRTSGSTTRSSHPTRASSGRSWTSGATGYTLWEGVTDRGERFWAWTPDEDGRATDPVLDEARLFGTEAEARQDLNEAFGLR